MSERTKRRLAFSSLIAAILAAGLIGAAAFIGRGDAPPIAAADVDEAPAAPEGFDLGTEAALERARFTGAPLLFVFLGPEDRALDAVRKAAAAPEVRAALPWYTPVLVDPGDPAEAEVEREARADGLSVVIRGLGGELLGGLKAPFEAEDLARLVLAVRGSHPWAPRPSPLWSLLRAEPEAIRKVAETDGRERAEGLVAEMALVEGEASEAVIALRAELAR